MTKLETNVPALNIKIIRYQLATSEDEHLREFERAITDRQIRTLYLCMAKAKKEISA